MRSPFFVLAPMDDVTDTVFRRIVADCAAPDMFFTEFVNVDGLCSPGKDRLQKKLQFTESEKPLIAQIWGKTPEHYYEVAKELATKGYAGIDINMGCPDKAVVKNGCCVALINNRELAGQIIEAVQRGVKDAGKPDLPISVKTRLGFNQVDYTWHEFLLGFNVDMLTIHCRTRKQMSKVPAEWDKITPIVALRDKISPTTKIVLNGDVETRQQGVALAKQFNVDGIMIGRGIFHDPYAFSSDSPWETMTPEDRKALYKKHIELFANTWHNNERPIKTLNKFCKIYINGFDGAKEQRELLMNAASIQELLAKL